MPDEVICNVCQKPITNPSEQIPRQYRIKLNGRLIGLQTKHDVCDAAYAAEKTGLEKIS